MTEKSPLQELIEYQALWEHLRDYRHQELIIPENSLGLRVDFVKDVLSLTTTLCAEWTLNGNTQRAQTEIPSLSTSTQAENIRNGLQDLSQKITEALTAQIHNELAERLTRLTYFRDAFPKIH